MEALAFLGRFWYIPALVAMAFALLYERNDNLRKEGDIKVASARIDALTTANQAAQRSLDTIAKQRPDNDAIAVAVASKVGAAGTREINTRTVIEKAVQNDPKALAVIDERLPDSVRQALRAH